MEILPVLRETSPGTRWDSGFVTPNACFTGARLRSVRRGSGVSLNLMEAETMDKTKDCRHFNGITNRECGAGIKYNSFPGSTKYGPKNRPCFAEDGSPPCETYAPWTAEELVEQDRKMQRKMDLMRQGLSSCCEAPFDENRVIREGRHKGHGPRYCSKCRKLVFMV